MFERAPFLGEVRLRGMGQAMNAGSGFMGPFGIYSDIGAPAGYVAPPGFPSTTQEEMRTYVCPDGTRQQMRSDEAAANGCVPASPTGPYARVASPGLMGRKMGQAPAPSGGPATQQNVAPAFAGTPQTIDSTRFFTPPFPLGYPGYVPPAPGKLTCKKIVNEDTGEETFECEPPAAPAAAPTYRYPVYFMNPYFF